MRAWTLPLLVLLAALAGCLGDRPGPSEEAPRDPTPDEPEANATEPAGEPVGTRVVATGDTSEIPFPMRLVIADPEEWTSFWREHEKKAYAEDGTQLPASEPPEVDFSRERVVVVTLGDVPDACAAVRVTDARAHEGRTTLTVTTYRGAAEEGCGEETRQPYVLVALPQDGSEVVYRDAEVVGRPPEGA